MITYQLLLEKLRKPGEIEIFKNRVSKLNAVDARDVKWQTTLPDLMTKFGFRNVGAGKYGTVFANDNYPYIIKIFMRDAAYLKWLNFCMQNQGNKWLPKIRGKVIKIGNLFMAVRLEKLTPYNMKGTPVDEKLYHDADELGDPEAKKVVDFLDANARLLDLHEGNAMMRGSQVVIIDPFYNFYRGGKYTIDPNDLSSFRELF